MENNELRATPAARKLAQQMGLDLFLVKGSGANGRVHKEDVETFKFEKQIRISPLARKIALDHNVELENVVGTGHNGKIMRDDILKLIAKPQETEDLARHEKAVVAEEKAVAQQDIEIVPMTAMRKVISKRMTPTFALNYEIDMTEAIALRKKILDTILESTGKKITITDIISFAVIKTLLKHKFVNSSLSEDGTQIILHNYVNLAIAVGFDGGLLVPVVKGADKMTLSELVVESKKIVKKALDMKLTPDEQTGSTFTISNLGMFGVQSFNPIINQPNSAILGVSSTVEKPVVVNGEITVRPMMTLTLTIDHRVVDGLAGAKFMQDLKNALENPIALLI